MRQLPSQSIQYLMESITRLSRLRKQHCSFHRRVCKQPLLPQYDIRWDRGKDCVQVWDILFIYKNTDLFPWNCVSKGENDIICYDHRDAPKYYSFYEPRAPWSPAQWAQAEYGPLHVLVIGCWVVSRDIKEWVVFEILPDCCSCTSVRLNQTVNEVVHHRIRIQFHTPRYNL